LRFQNATGFACKTLAGIVDRHSNMKKLIVLIAVVFLTSYCTDNKTKMTEEELNKVFARDSAQAMKDPLVKLDKDSVKKAYGDKFNDLRTIINKHDPIGLISNGAPDDEYEPEVKTIIVQLDNKKTEQQIHDLVYQEFIRWFECKLIVFF
jgi:hypothetical protein